MKISREVLLKTVSCQKSPITVKGICSLIGAPTDRAFCRKTLYHLQKLVDSGQLVAHKIPRGKNFSWAFSIKPTPPSLFTRIRLWFTR